MRTKVFQSIYLIYILSVNSKTKFDYIKPRLDFFLDFLLGKLNFETVDRIVFVIILVLLFLIKLQNKMFISLFDVIYETGKAVQLVCW